MIKRIWLIIIVVGLISMVTVGIVVYRCISGALEAETTLHANCDVLEILELYIEQNPGQWPENWNDLQNTTLPTEWERQHLRPQDIEEFKKRVQVNFGLTLQEVADMLTPEQVKRWDFANFTAVRPIGPNYGPCESGLAHFMEVVWRENSKAKKGKALQKVRGDIYCAIRLCNPDERERQR